MTEPKDEKLGEEKAELTDAAQAPDSLQAERTVDPAIDQLCEDLAVSTAETEAESSLALKVSHSTAPITACLNVSGNHQALPRRIVVLLFSFLLCAAFLSGCFSVADTVPFLAVLVLIIGLAFAPVKPTPPGELISIRFTEKEIRFSNSWKMDLGGKLLRNWSDVHSIVLSGKSADCNRIKWGGTFASFFSPSLHFSFTSGGSATVFLSRWERNEATKIFEAIDRWADMSILSAEAVQLKESLLGSENVSDYTELWNKDLEMRHSSTCFLPLPKGIVLQDGRLTVSTILATGGFSAVYLAQDAKGEKLILKEASLPPNMEEAGREKSRELFQREARILMKLDHPHIAKILDHFREHGRDYLVLEHIPGKTLRQLVKVSGPQSEERVLDWSEQIASTIAYLHAQQPPVVHRDLTPDNLMIKEDGTIVLVDFGAANELIGSATGTMIGKQSYIPPEQLRGKANPKSDIYALGATMYFALTGKDPIPLSCSEPKQIKPYLSADLNELVKQATELDVTARIESADQLIRQLRSVGEKSGAGR